MKIKRFIAGFFPALAMLILILDSKTALSGAREGIQLCINNVIPSLFPFFVLSGMLMNALWGQSLKPLALIGRLFRLPEGAESLLLPAFLGGYPVGVQSVVSAFTHKQINQKEAQRLLMFCSNPGPAFIFGILGNCFENPIYIWAAWGAQIFSALLLSRTFSRKQKTAALSVKAERTSSQLLTDSITVMAKVCGWVVLFRMMIGFGEKWFLWIVPAEYQVILTGLLELTNGCCRLMLVKDPQIRFLICCGLLSFGGICVFMQVASLIEGLSISQYIAGQILQCTLSVLFAGAVLGNSVCFLAILISFIFPVLGKIKKSSRIPKRIHV